MRELSGQRASSALLCYCCHHCKSTQQRTGGECRNSRGKDATVSQRRNRNQPRLTLASSVCLFTLGQIGTTAASSFKTGHPLEWLATAPIITRDPSRSKISIADRMLFRRQYPHVESHIPNTIQYSIKLGPILSTTPGFVCTHTFLGQGRRDRALRCWGAGLALIG